MVGFRRDEDFCGAQSLDDRQQNQEPSSQQTPWERYATPQHAYQQQLQCRRSGIQAHVVVDRPRDEPVHRLKGDKQRRQDAGLEVSDRIKLILDGDAELLDAVRTHQSYVAGETLAIEITYADLDGAEPVMIDGRPLKIGIALA